MVLKSGGGSSSVHGARSSPVPQGAQQQITPEDECKMPRWEKHRLETQSEPGERKKQKKITDPKLDWSKNMDPEVWGNLPSNLTVEICKRLPFPSCYQLRVVCKDWDLVARERRWATDPVPKPYFVLIHEGGGDEVGYEEWSDDEQILEDLSTLKNDQSDDDEEEFESEEELDAEDFEEHEGNYLHGVLTFQIKSGCWRWQKLHSITSYSDKLLYKPFSVKGLTFSRELPKTYGSGRNYQVFDSHTKKRYTVPRRPVISKTPLALGMTVDTTIVPYSFKIILGSLDGGTQIYDSVTKSWETRSSRLLVPCGESKFKSCVHCGDDMYIWSQLDKIRVYSLEEDKWRMLNPLPWHSERDLMDQFVRIRECLGSWQGRMFAVTSDNRGDEYPKVWMWELVDQCEQRVWEFLDEMSDDLQRWMIPPRFCLEYEEIQVFASFCDDRVLVYSWVPEDSRAIRFVSYNLATKKWEKVKAPSHLVGIDSDNEKDTDKWDVENPLQGRIDADYWEGYEGLSGDDSDVNDRYYPGDEWL